MKKFLLSMIILILVMAAVVPACSSSTADDTQAFCTSLQNLAGAVVNVKSINAATSVDQAKQYNQDLQNAWNDAVNAKKNLSVSKFTDLQNAYNQLKSSLDSISGTQTVAQALPSIQAALTTFEADLDSIRITVCNFTPTKTNTP